MSKKKTTEPKTVLLLIATWQRANITHVCFEGVARLIAQSKHHIEPLIMIDDESNAALTELFGFGAIHVANDPDQLGYRFNVGLTAAMEMKWDYLMQLGSDDLLTNEAMRRLDDAIDAGVPSAGFRRIYLWDAKTGKAKNVRIPWVFGAGRIICREHIEYAIQLHGSLWPDDIAHGLDLESEARFMDHPKNEMFPLDNDDRCPLVLDIKDGNNIHAWDELDYQEGEALTVRKVRDDELKFIRDNYPEVGLI